MGMKMPEVLRSKEMGVGRHNLHYWGTVGKEMDFNNLRSRSNMANYYLCVSHIALVLLFTA